MFSSGNQPVDAFASAFKGVTAGVVRVGTCVGAEGADGSDHATCSNGRRNRSILFSTVDGSVYNCFHFESRCPAGQRPRPILAPAHWLGHPDASLFLATCHDTVPDALCGSACRLLFSDTANLPHVRFQREPTVHTKGSTGFHGHNAGRCVRQQNNDDSGKTCSPVESPVRRPRGALQGNTEERCSTWSIVRVTAMFPGGPGGFLGPHPCRRYQLLSHDIPMWPQCTAALHESMKTLRPRG